MRSSNGGIRRAIDVVQRAGARYPWAGRIQALDAAVRTDQAADEHQHRRITACPFPKATGTYLHCSGLLRLEHKGVALTRCAETDAQRVRGQSGSRRAPACSAGDPSVAGKRPDTLMQQSWPTSSLAPARDARLSTVDAPSLGDEIATVAAAPGSTGDATSASRSGSITATTTRLAPAREDHQEPRHGGETGAITRGCGYLRGARGVLRRGNISAVWLGANVTAPLSPLRLPGRRCRFSSSPGRSSLLCQGPVAICGF